MCDVKLSCLVCGEIKFDNITTEKSSMNLFEQGYQVLRCSNKKCGASFKVKLERVIFDIQTTFTIKI